MINWDFSREDITTVLHSCQGSIWKKSLLQSFFTLLTIVASNIPVFTILTQLAYIANGKKSCSILQQFTGRKCVALFSAVLWRHPSHRPCLLDVSRCNIVLRVINVRNKCNRLHYSQTFGGISLVQRRNVGRIWRIQLLFHRFLCVRIEIDQL